MTTESVQDIIELVRHEGSQRPPLAELIDRSTAEGFLFLRRLAADWQSGANRFSQPGELLITANCQSQIVGVAGLSIDPYTTDPRIGRIRRLYVLPSHRRIGLGRRIVTYLIDNAQPTFNTLRLRTDSEVADRFYLALGFSRVVNSEKATHQLDLIAR